MLRQITGFFAALMAFCLFSASAQAASPLRAEVEQYLTDLTTVVADFVQVAPDGSLSSGTFYLKRPRNMRWQYEPPTPILMVTRGSYLTYYDYELQQVSDIPLSDTLLGVFTQPQVRFSGRVKVVDEKEGPGSYRVSLVQADDPKQGKLTLEFATTPLQLRNFVVLDSSGQTTTVSLNNARFGVPIDEELFTFKDPRVGGRNKRRP